MNSTQMLKGILEGCLLAVISEEEVYGYEMTKKLELYGFNMVSEGSIYPLLIRMKKEGLVTTTTKESESGPKRKYYSLTDKGQEGFNMVSEGSIYPLLIRMKKEGLVTTTTKESESGPKRKYYSLTDKGQEQLADFMKIWKNISMSVNRLLEGK